MESSNSAALNNDALSTVALQRVWIKEVQTVHAGIM